MEPSALNKSLLNNKATGIVVWHGYVYTIPVSYFLVCVIVDAAQQLATKITVVIVKRASSILICIKP